ncbi:KilA-N domain protein [Candidatus Nitrosymbiomonas proteolyticus]|uniref:KilA-N domain protein n=1 Tax=Candidatus Nitrosymbiomonas proteolyticus TaxID=2608984 RepID=A0A809SDP0_9BACT|nr:KilA-N domain protein [Candidatus Nitrosymbiomonas proteolyticus]
MRKSKQAKISVAGTDISVVSDARGDYISLTDMTRGFDGGPALIEQWMRAKDTILFLGAWESLHNPNFKPHEFGGFRNEAGRNSFYMSPKKWVEATGAIGIYSQSGRYGGGTFAHRDIAFEFGTWLSPEFKLYLIKEFQRLKEAEAERQSLEWNLNRSLSKLNYRIHTDAVREHLIPPNLTKRQESFVYADEADLLNVALFGKTAKQWRDANPELEGNMRDYATTAQLLVMVNLESLNAQWVRDGLKQPERLRRLREAAVSQLKSLGSISLRSIDRPPSLPMRDDEGEE